jgi:hypothetical protein
MEREVDKACERACGRMILDKLSKKLEERIGIMKRDA